MSWWIAFPITVVFVILHGYLARWIAGSFVPEGSKSIAGFSFVLGMAYMASGPISSMSTELKLAATLDYVLGVAIIWYLFFKREAANG